MSDAISPAEYRNAIQAIVAEQGYLVAAMSTGRAKPGQMAMVEWLEDQPFRISARTDSAEWLRQQTFIERMFPWWYSEGAHDVEGKSFYRLYTD